MADPSASTNSNGALLPPPANSVTNSEKPAAQTLWSTTLWSVLRLPFGLLRRIMLFPRSCSAARRPCIFCDVSREKGFNIVLQDDTFVAFHDRSPAAQVHLLVVPRQHWVNVVHWPATSTSVDRVTSMRAFGQRALEVIRSTSSTSGACSTGPLVLPADRLKNSDNDQEDRQQPAWGKPEDYPDHHPPPAPLTSPSPPDVERQAWTPDPDAAHDQRFGFHVRLGTPAL